MKDIEDEIPFEIPDGWAWCKFKELALDMADGPFGSNLKTEHYTTKKEARLIQLSNIGEYGWREGNTKYTTFEHARKNIPRSIVEPGNLVIAKMMPAGRAIVCPSTEKMYVLSSDAVKVIPTSFVDKQFVLNAINSPSFRNSVTDNVQGTTRLRTSISKLKECLFPLPPYSEQKRIVCRINDSISIIDFLDVNKNDLDGLIKQAKSKILDLAIHGKLVSQDQNDEPAEELLKRIATSDNRPYLKIDENNGPFEIPSTWAWCRGKEIFAPMTTKKPDGITFRYIDIDTIDNKTHCIVNPKTIAIEKAPIRASRELFKGDILFSLVRPYLENIAFVEEQNEDCIASTGFYICRPRSFLYPKYAFYLMITDYVVKGLNQFMKGDNSPSISGDDIKNWWFPIPPINEQARIVTKIKELFNQLDTIAKQLA